MQITTKKTRGSDRVSLTLTLTEAELKLITTHKPEHFTPSTRACLEQYGLLKGKSFTDLARDLNSTNSFGDQVQREIELKLI